MTETDPDAVRDAPQTSSNQPPTDPVAPPPSGQPDEPPVDESSVPSPGDVNDEHGHVAVARSAALGTSEESPQVEGIRTTAIAQPGKPDGEVAT